MPTTMTIEADGTVVLRIQGVLSRADLAACEDEISPRIDAGEHPLILVLIEDFGGWRKGDDWVDSDFMFTRGERIGRIAIVGAGDKEDEMKAFTGAGLRPTPVGCFESEGEARSWLAGG